MLAQARFRKYIFRRSPASTIWLYQYFLSRITSDDVIFILYDVIMTAFVILLSPESTEMYFFRNGCWTNMSIEWSNVFLGHFYGRIWRNPVTMTSYNVNMTSSEVILDKKYWYNHIIETGDLRNVFFRDGRWTNMKIEGSDFFLGHFYGKLWRNAILMNYHDVISAMTSLWHFCGNRRYQQTSYFGSGGGELHH